MANPRLLKIEKELEALGAEIKAKQHEMKEAADLVKAAMADNRPFKFLEADYRNLGKQLDRMYEKDKALEDERKTLSAGAPCQIDEDHLARIGPSSKLMYAHLLLRHGPSLHPTSDQCFAHALVDTGSEFDLVLPGKKAKHLNLEFIRTRLSRGHGGGCVEMMEFSPLEVIIKLDPNAAENVRATMLSSNAFQCHSPHYPPLLQRGYLHPVAARSEYESADDHQTVQQNKMVFDEYPKVIDRDGTSCLQFSPVQRPRVPGVIPEAILGLPGLERLGLAIDPQHSRIFPLVEIGLII